GPAAGKARRAKPGAAGEGLAVLAQAAGLRPGRPGRPKGERKGRKKAARFDTESEGRGKKKRARLEKMRRAGIFGVPGRPRRLKRKKSRDEMVRPSPPLEKTEPLKHYLAGEMVPCPVGCGGFSEVVRISTTEMGGGEVWFECLSCAQRRQFDLPAATVEERRQIQRSLESGHEPLCPRHTKIVQLRRRGRDFVCPECGVAFPEP
ncbi:MAG TPA: hypothetical protein VMN60_04645, partial [Longimicrobiales bacterium]|nr:hypothetical protein [Longimicrobiales bacterium]